MKAFFDLNFKEAEVSVNFIKGFEIKNCTFVDVSKNIFISTHFQDCVYEATNSHSDMFSVSFVPSASISLEMKLSILIFTVFVSSSTASPQTDAQWVRDQADLVLNPIENELAAAVTSSSAQISTEFNKFTSDVTAQKSIYWTCTICHIFSTCKATRSCLKDCTKFIPLTATDNK